MTAVLGTRVRTGPYTAAQQIGTWFLAAMMFCDFFSLPYRGRLPLIGVGVVGCLSVVFFSKDELKKIRISFPILGLVTWCLLSTFWSVAVWKTTIGIELFGLSSIAIMMIVSILPTELVVKGLLRGAYGTVLLTCASLVVAPGTTLVDENGYRSVHGWFLHKNAMAPYMVIVVAMVLALETRKRWRFWMLFLCILLIVTSLSATGLIGLVLAFAFNGMAKRLHSDERGRQASIIASVLGSALVLGYLVTSYLPEIVGAYGKDVTLSGRTKIWSAVWWAIGQRPWTGYGLDAAFQEPSNLIDSLYARIGFVPAHAHQGILDVTISLGIVGAFFVMWIYLSAWRTSLKYTVAGVPMARAMWVLISLTLVMSISESTLGFPGLYLPFIMRMLALRWNAGDPIET